MLQKSLFSRLLWLFGVNVWVSCLAVGGGYMIIPLVRKPFVDKEKIVDFDELLEMYAIAQSAPGAIAINLAAVLGFRVAGILGAIVSCVASILPPLLMISAVALCYEQLIHNTYINAALKGMLAAIAAIILDVVCDMFKNVMRAKEVLGLYVVAGVFALSFLLNVNAICLIAGMLVLYVSVSFYKFGKK